MKKLKAALNWFLAWSRFSLKQVCELSQNRGPIDFHEMPDATPGSWDGFFTCERCGKRFFA